MPLPMGAGVRGIGGLHLSEAAYGDCDVRIGGAAQLVEEVDIGHLAIELVLGTGRAAASACGYLQVEAAEDRLDGVGTPADSAQEHVADEVTAHPQHAHRHAQQ